MKKTKTIYTALLAVLVVAGCKDTDDLSAGSPASYPDEAVIHVGGINADDMVAGASMTRNGGGTIVEDTVTRIDAEKIAWLAGPLKKGLDITYGNVKMRDSTERVAILKLLTDENDDIKYSDGGLAEYSFKYRDTGAPAIWYDNGAHFFEGLHVPDNIMMGEDGFPADLTADQHDDNTTEPSLGNYTLLSHYLAMPSNYTVNATVARIKLPFRHRLARVLAYILIDPELGDTTKIEGYNLVDGRDDPTTSQIRFCNVAVLDGVVKGNNGMHDTFTPQWTVARKVVPHFVGERGSYDDAKNKTLNADHFLAYYDVQKKTFIYPTDTAWTRINNYFSDVPISSDKFMDTKGNYQRTTYGKVPVYDLIVRPTYSALNRVMYDEAGSASELYGQTNQIDFELTLNTGLHYTKNFVFDLDANYQTVVYLHISRERVDYNSSGSDLWQEDQGYDDYYGVNNENGHTLSMAGSSWQRAFTNSNEQHGVTDGHLYRHDEEDQYAQYVTDSLWIEMLREAHEGGLNHGDYFILDRDISIPAAAFPEGFVFTGHLDGQDHTITITDGPYNAVTERPSYTYTDYDNESGKNGGANELKFSEVGGKYVELDPAAASMNWYERHETIDDPESGVVVTYTPISDILAYGGNVAYVWTGGDKPVTNDDDDYMKFEFYKRILQPAETTTVPAKAKPYYLFAGLNGKYRTAQENNEVDIWEANVHKENGKWVPYTNGTDGWRAEIINVNFKIDTEGDDACSVFKPGAVWGTDVTGYLYNCWVNSTYDRSTHKWSKGSTGSKVNDYVPAIPMY